MTHTLSAIAAALGARAEGDLSLEVARLAHPAEAGPDDLAFASDPAHEALLGRGGARAALLREGADWRGLGLDGAVFAPRPRHALAGATALFDAAMADAPGVHPSAVVAADAVIDPSASVGPLCVVGAGARIGARTRLLGQVWVAPGARIGTDGLIHAGVRIGRNVVLGDRAIIQPNAVIGGDGFSFVTPERGAVEAAKSMESDAAARQAAGFARIHSLGGVVVGDDVEIGAGSCIDAGTLAPTRIGDGVKMDNLVQIGHNAQVGSTCLICGQVGVAGSVRIGDRVVLGGGAGVADHIEIGSDSMIGARSAVAQSAPPGSVLLGSPALPRRETLQIVLAWRRLPDLLTRIRRLEKGMDADQG